MSSRPAYPLAGIASAIAGHQGLPHGELAAPIERGGEVNEWEEQQRPKKRADVVAKDRDLSQTEKAGVDRRVCEWESKTVRHRACILPRGFVRFGKAGAERGPGGEAMSVKVSDRIITAPTTSRRSVPPTQTTRPLPDERSLTDETGFGPLATSCTT
ncbi:hypothetical protein FRC12_004651 [Ceratobasidium sp. 428]|nr:hypothetical protein FRC12_004651 [Ceratobasidium sp. 428]